MPSPLVACALLVGVLAAAAGPLAAPCSAARPTDAATLRATVTDKRALLHALEKRRDAVLAALTARQGQLEQARLQVVAVNYRLAQVEAQYEQTFASCAASLSAIYKFSDQSAWNVLLNPFDFTAAETLGRWTTRVTDQERLQVVAMNAQADAIASMQAAVLALKERRMIEERELSDQLDALNAVIAAKAADLQTAEKTLAAAQPAPAPSVPAVPPPPSGAQPTGTPPAGLHPTGLGFSGLASWYGPGFNGLRTANGETYDMYAFTCASRTLPFNTWLRVTFRGQSTFVRVNDRGPVAPERVLDLSYGAAKALHMVSAGVGLVDVEIWR
jgi:hypothetical protein